MSVLGNISNDSCCLYCVTHNQTRRTRREQRTVEAMIRIYCRSRHDGISVPCAECRDLYAYALCRIDRCPYGADKPTCAKCPIHCYKPEFRERITEVMRFAGPRMASHHPILALHHLLDEQREVPPRPSGPRD